MKTKILIVVLMMSFTTGLLAQNAVNGPRKEFRGPQREMKMNKGENRGPLQGLNLTDTQKAAFKQSMLAIHKQLQPLNNELGEAMAHQKTLMGAEKPDLSAIDRNIEKIGDLRVKMAKIKAKNHLELRSQLTDEQRIKFDLFSEKMLDDRGAMGMHQMKPMHKGVKQNRNMPKEIQVK